MDDIINNEEMTVEVVTFQDDEGNEFDMEIVEEFEHNGKRYAVLCETSDECCEEEHEHDECGCCDCCGEDEALYIFEIVEGDEGEEFVAIEDDGLLDELSTVVENLLFSEDEE